MLKNLGWKHLSEVSERAYAQKLCFARVLRLILSGLGCWNFLNSPNMSTGRLGRAGLNYMTSKATIATKSLGLVTFTLLGGKLGVCETHGVGVR